MAFTMEIDDAGDFRPAAICDLCGSAVGGQGLVLWGSYVEGELPRYAAIDTEAAKVPATVLVACSTTCARKFPQMIGDVYEEGSTLPTIPVADYIGSFAQLNGINLSEIRFIGVPKDVR